MKKVLITISLSLLFVALVGCDKTLLPTAATTKKTGQSYDLDSLAGEEINITFWHTWGKSKSAVLDAQITEFANMMLDKYEITVNVTADSHSDYPTILSKTNQAIAAGNKDNMPTLVAGYPDHFAQYIKSRAVVSLDPYINSPTEGVGVDLTKYVDAYITENNQFNDTMYSLPLSKSAEFMAYNKSITDANDIDIPEDRPLTWTEIVAMKEKLIGYTGNSADVQYLVNYDSTDNLFINFSRQLNAKYTTNDGQLLVTDPTTVQMVTYVQTLIKNKYLSIPYNYSDTANYASDYFKQQKMVFTIGSTAGYSYNMNGGVAGGETAVLDPKANIKYDYEMGFALVPQFELDPRGEEASKSVVQQGPNVCILDSGTDAETLMAWMLIRYMTYLNQYNPESDAADADGFVDGQNNSARFAISTGYFPVTKEAYTSVLYSKYINLAKSFYEKNYDYSTFTEEEQAMLKGGYPQIAYIGQLQTSYYQFDPAFPASSKLLGSASIRDEAAKTINKIGIDLNYDAAKALQELLDVCTLS